MSSSNRAKQYLAQQTGREMSPSQSPVGMRSDEVQKYLNQYSATISQLMPGDEGHRKLIAMLTTIFSNDDKIRRCTPASIVGAALQCALIGLDPTPEFGQVYFVPYGNQLTMQIGYRGYIQLAYNTGNVEAAYAYEVYENDLVAPACYRIQLGLNRDIIHIPTQGERGALYAVYAVIRYKHGDFDFEAMTKSDVLKIKMASPSSNKSDSPWVKWEAMQWRKSVIKRLMKRQPLSKRDMRILESDGAIITPESFNLEDRIIEPAHVVQVYDENQPTAPGTAKPQIKTGVKLPEEDKNKIKLFDAIYPSVLKGDATENNVEKFLALCELDVIKAHIKEKKIDVTLPPRGKGEQIEKPAENPKDAKDKPKVPSKIVNLRVMLTNRLDRLVKNQLDLVLGNYGLESMEELVSSVNDEERFNEIDRYIKETFDLEK